MPVTIAYLVHDLGDAAVARRAAAIVQGGGEVRLAGFARRPPPTRIAGIRPLPLGRSKDARLAQRALLVLRVMLAPRRLTAMLEGAEVILARNLEMLLIAAHLRGPNQRLVYECLDIHRVMLRDGPAGRIMRALERWLLGQVDLVIVSSPAFERSYFRSRQRYAGPIDLIENKVQAAPEFKVREAPTGPWTIGWFGMLRCRRSLALLGQLSAASSGRIKVLIAGIPSPSEFPEFEAEVAQASGIEFAGSYSAEDLPQLYGRVHFAWCIDYFEEGLNSRWLLPNRLYESIAHGAVPVALTDVETGRWLINAGIGLTLDDASMLGPVLAALNGPEYAALRNGITALPRSRIAFSPQNHQHLVARLKG